MIPSSTLFDQPTLTSMLDHDPLIQHYRAVFALFDWSVVEHWIAARSSRGRTLIHPERVFLKTFLLRINAWLLYTIQTREFLSKHPLLIIELGFHPILDPTQPYGF